MPALSLISVLTGATTGAGANAAGAASTGKDSFAPVLDGQLQAQTGGQGKVPLPALLASLIQRLSPMAVTVEDENSGQEKNAPGISALVTPEQDVIGRIVQFLTQNNVAGTPQEALEQLGQLDMPQIAKLAKLLHLPPAAIQKAINQLEVLSAGEALEAVSLLTTAAVSLNPDSENGEATPQPGLKTVATTENAAAEETESLQGTDNTTPALVLVNPAAEVVTNNPSPSAPGLGVAAVARASAAGGGNEVPPQPAAPAVEVAHAAAAGLARRSGKNDVVENIAGNTDAVSEVAASATKSQAFSPVAPVVAEVVSGSVNNVQASVPQSAGQAQAVASQPAAVAPEMPAVQQNAEAAPELAADGAEAATPKTSANLSADFSLTEGVEGDAPNPEIAAHALKEANKQAKSAASGVNAVAAAVTGDTTAGTNALLRGDSELAPLREMAATASLQTHAGAATKQDAAAAALTRADGTIPPAEQVLLKIRSAPLNSQKHYEIHLEPADLGRVEVRMELQADGRTHVTMTVDKRDTLDLLQRDRFGLEKALNELGLKADAGSMQFNLREQPGGGQQMADGQQGENGSWRQDVLPEELREENPPAQPYRGMILNLDEGVNIQV